MITTFDSWEELETAMTNDRVAADSKISEAQTRIQAGDYAISQSEGITIIGEILAASLNEPEDAEDAEEADETEDAAEHEAWSRSFVFGRWYSKLLLTGECGDKHRSVLEKITKKTFEEELAKLSSSPYYVVILGAGPVSPQSSIGARIMSTLRLQQTIRSAPLTSTAEILARKHFPQEYLDRWLERQRTNADAWCVTLRISSDDEAALCATEAVWLFTTLNA